MRPILLAALLALGGAGCRGAEAPGATPAAPDPRPVPRPMAPTAVALDAQGGLWLGTLDGAIRVERPAGGTEDLGPLHTGAVRSFLFEDGRLRWSIASDSAARFDAEGRVAARYRLPGHHLNGAEPLPARAGAEPAEDLLVAAERGDVARLGPEGALRWRVRGHHGRAAFAVAARPAPGGPTEAVSVGSDGRLSRWRLTDGAPLGEARTEAPLLRARWLEGALYTLSVGGRLTRWAVPEGPGDPRPEVQRETAAVLAGGPREAGGRPDAEPAATGLLADDRWLYVATRGGHVRSYRAPGLDAGPVFSPPGSAERPDAPAIPTPGLRPDPTVRALDVRDDTLVVVHADGRVVRHAIPRRGLPPPRRIEAQDAGPGQIEAPPPR